ncbi:hypothetical protein F4861DRAFT_64315 [Xylaria intraflava]|nr:hypothetical protein F4861DRAFT_64315 [Xylaria intraflava]
MYNLSHEDLTVSAGIYIPRARLAGSDGNLLKNGLNPHQWAGYRLSCISENQKENSQHSEDEYFGSTAQTPKTPVLEPVRWPQSRHRGDGKSRSCDDRASVSPFQLDLEQIGTYWKQGMNHHRVLSTRRSATPGRLKKQTGQHDTPGTRPKVSGPVSPRVLEVQWRIIQRTAAQSKNAYTKSHRRNLPGTGFDGPRSSASGTSPFQAPSDASSAQPRPLPLSSGLSRETRRHELNTPGVLDWEKRKPQKRHDVSETSDAEQSTHAHPPGAPSTMGTMDAPIIEEQKHQFDKVEETARKSCPEFYRRSLSGVPPAISTLIVERDRGLKPPDYSRFNGSPHRRRLRVPDSVSKRFQSLRDRLHRCRSSSMHSIRPEFPPPPDGKERRFRSRNSDDIWPSSGEESPVFNTPESRISPMQPTGLLVASGLVIASGGLDRLGGQTNEGTVPRTSITLSELARCTSGTSSPWSESGSSAVDTAGTDPDNSPSPSFPPTRSSSMVSRIPQRSGRNRRRLHSRLSEMATPAETDDFSQPADGKPILHSIVSSSSDPLQDTSFDYEAGRPELVGSQPPSTEASTTPDDGPNRKPWVASGVMQISRKPLPGVAGGPGNKQSERPFPRARSVEPRGEWSNPSDRGNTGQHVPDKATSKLQHSITTRAGGLNRRRPSSQMDGEEISSTHGSGLLGNVAAHANAVEHHSILERLVSESCHPDTWSAGRGEPGDSEPFCPPSCLFSDRCDHGSKARRSRYKGKNKMC